ncbi:MAG TPA: hypothetical protein ENJ56_02295 [Anaerolineae bacterium]|nr:hypothetical protein [Anaerolineae bacterium]
MPSKKLDTALSMSILFSHAALRRKLSYWTFILAAMVGLFPSVAFVWAIQNNAHNRRFIVDSRADTPDAIKGDGVCGDLAGNCTLRAAIDEANHHPGTDTIVLSATTLTISRFLHETNQNYYGDFDILQSVNIEGAGMGNTIIKANGLTRIFDIQATARTVSISGLTLQGGVAVNDNGGAIRAIKTTLRLDSIEMVNNAATWNGGALYLADSETVATNLHVVDNSAESGGGIFVFGGSFDLQSGEIAQNIAHHYAGGIAALGGENGRAHLRLGAVSVQNNRADSGGGLYVRNGVLTLSGAQIGQNFAEVAGGGVVMESAEIAIETSTISQNYAASGGGIALVGSASLQGDAQQIKDNSSDGIAEDRDIAYQ